MSSREWFDPTPEQQNVVFVDEPTIRRAERWVKSCEGCTPAEAQVPFLWVLDRITRSDPKVTDYLMVQPARCPRCSGVIQEFTIVQLRDNDDPRDDEDVPNALNTHFK
jgi:hypothetical protein